MPRHRVEDLGRISVMLRNVLENDLFSSDPRYLPGRPKDCHEWFSNKTDEEKYDVLRTWCYGIETICSDLYDILSVAEGTDLLNEKEEER